MDLLKIWLWKVKGNLPDDHKTEEFNSWVCNVIRLQVCENIDPLRNPSCYLTRTMDFYISNIYKKRNRKGNAYGNKHTEFDESYIEVQPSHEMNVNLKLDLERFRGLLGGLELALWDQLLAGSTQGEAEKLIGLNRGHAWALMKSIRKKFKRYYKG